MRPALCEEALRLGRILAGLAPEEPEVHGLLALMELQASRQAARIGPRRPAGPARRPGARAAGPAADRARAGRARAGRGAGRPAGAYYLQAAIAACHARAARLRGHRLGADRRALRAARGHRRSPSSNSTARSRSGWRSGRRSACRPSTRSPRDGSLDRYHLLPSVRGDMLEKLGRLAEARHEFERAATMTRNERERSLLEARASECGSPGRR